MRSFVNKDCLFYQVIEEMREAEFVACTTDFWTSVANDSYIGVTAHFIGEDFTLKHRLLCLRKYSSDKTGDNIRNTFTAIIVEWQFQDKLEAVVTDAAANCIKAFEKSNFEHITCNAHNLHNAVCHALKLETVESLMKSVRAIVGHFKHSSKQEEKLKNKQQSLGKPVSKLQQEVVTRWNSTFNMIDSILDNEESVDSVLKESKKHSDLQLAKSQWKQLRAFHDVLVQPAQITEQMSGSSYPTMSLIWPMFTTLVSNLDAVKGVARAFADTIAAGIRQRNGNFSSVSVEVLSSALDPRFKALSFVKDSLRAEVYRTILKLLKNIDNHEPMPKKSKQNQQQYALFGLDAPVESSPAEVEWKSYLSEESPGLSVSCLSWWAVNKNRYPRLAVLARKYLCVPATSVPSEQLFSHAGDTITKKRNALKPEHAELLIFVSDNYKHYYEL